MLKCPNCSEQIAEGLSRRNCPNCGTEFSNLPEDSSKTANFDGLTVVGTMDVESNHSIASTVDVQCLEASSTNQNGVSSASDVTFDEELSKLANEESLKSKLGQILDNAHMSPGATISIGASGVSIGSSSSRPPVMRGTVVDRSKKTDGNGKTARGSGTEDTNTSIDFNQSILSTISRRTLTEKTKSLASPPDYEIVSKLGEGGMGVVYSAIQKTLDRKVAVKAIKAGKSTSDESRRKFFYEAQITSDLDHPNIVPIHEMGANDDGTLFYSMKMVDGTPWEDAILDKSREENIEILMKVCDAVAFAHSRNIIHRDLKPENVMLGAFGEVLVMDWGLAVNLNTTQTFGMSGTPVYMSPEMAKHDLTKIGQTSDIYILGGILFQIVVGKAPHKGNSVRECIANAIQNINIDPGIEDPLLDIANRAMATEPQDRYASVLDFQDAIREYLRYDQSIALTHRAEELLRNSILDKDYQGFSRALFSMQDAIELWPENQAAMQGLNKTRLAYGQCALERSDYDLCLQTLDPSIDDEASLYRLALERKAELIQRDKRFKLLRKVLASVILFAGVALTIATLYARRQEALAIQSAQSEKDARINEETAKQIAVSERDKARQSEREEKVARKEEEEAKQVAQAERDRAVIAEKQEKEAKELEVVAREQAVASEHKARQSEQVAVRNARIALLGNYQSELNLALNQNAQFDLGRSNQLLNQIKAIENRLSTTTNSPDGKLSTHGPVLQNWAYRRIEMLNNSDLPRVHLDSPITAFQIAKDACRGIVGTRNGKLNIVELENGRVSIVPNRTLVLQDPIYAVAITPDSLEAIVATGTQRSDYSVFRWNTVSNEVIPVRSMGKRNLQRLVISPNSKWAVGGISAGLWKWERGVEGFESEPSLLDAKGGLQSLHFVGESNTQLFGLSKLPNGRSVCILAHLATDEVQTFTLPDAIAQRVSAAAMSIDQKQIYLGLDNGNLLVAKTEASPDNARGVSTPQNAIIIGEEIQPRMHATAIRGIEVHQDGSILSFADEPVIHLWKSDPSSGNLTYASFLVGLNGNVTSAKFLNHSGIVVATDDLGDMIQWNTSDQARRHVQIQTASSRLLAQSIATDGTYRSLDSDGVLTIRAEEKTLSHFIGHTPGAKVTDVVAATIRPLIATIALLPTSGTSRSNSSELCIWDTSTHSMLNRSRHDTAGACRLAFVNGDQSLLIADGKDTITIEAYGAFTASEEKRFGTRLAVNHPISTSISALIGRSGAVRIVDWQVPTKWEDPNYRNFDIAINNRFEPIEAAWSLDGKRLFILFEHGRIARFDWDGTSLANLNWSGEIAAIRSVEQETPWRFLNLESIQNNNEADQLLVELRTAEATAKCVSVQVDWERSENKPRTSPDLASSSSKLGNAQPNIFGTIRTANGATVDVAHEGTLFITQPNNQKLLLGRPRCVKASGSGDGKRWSTVHKSGCVLLAIETASGDVGWQFVKHPFAEVTQSELSTDGHQLALVGGPVGGPYQLLRFEIDGSGVVLPVGNNELLNVRFAKWFPVENELIVLTVEKKWSRINAQGEIHSVQSKAWDQITDDSRLQFVDMQWLREPNLANSELLTYMAVLSRSKEASRIDFLGLNEESSSDIQPITTRAEITSFATAPKENILAVADEKGTLGIWFASPSIDQLPRELFTLQGHRGSRVIQVSFSSDGSKLLSSDMGQKFLWWRSR